MHIQLITGMDNGNRGLEHQKLLKNKRPNRRILSCSNKKERKNDRKITELKKTTSKPKKWKVSYWFGVGWQL